MIIIIRTLKYWLFVADIIKDSNQSSSASTVHPLGKTLYQYLWRDPLEWLTLVFKLFKSTLIYISNKNVANTHKARDNILLPHLEEQNLT